MPSDSPRQTSAEGGRPEGGASDPLDALSERMRAAQETAERLVAEASRAAEEAAAETERERAERPPPRGYAAPGRGDSRSLGAEAQALVALLDLGRTILPAELRAQIAELLRELLLLARAIIDWYLERLDARRRQPVEVQDIPIS